MKTLQNNTITLLFQLLLRVPETLVSGRSFEISYIYNTSTANDRGLDRERKVHVTSVKDQDEHLLDIFEQWNMLNQIKSIWHFIMQRFIPQKGNSPFTLRVVLKQPVPGHFQFKFMALTSHIRVDGKTEQDADHWIKLSDISSNFQLEYNHQKQSLGSSTLQQQPQKPHLQQNLDLMSMNFNRTHLNVTEQSIEQLELLKRKLLLLDHQIQRGKDLRRQFCTIDCDYQHTRVTDIKVGIGSSNFEDVKAQVTQLCHLTEKTILKKSKKKISQLVVDFLYDSIKGYWTFLQIKSYQLFEEKISKEKQNDFNTGDFSTKSGTSFMTSINSSPLQRFQSKKQLSVITRNLSVPRSSMNLKTQVTILVNSPMLKRRNLRIFEESFEVTPRKKYDPLQKLFQCPGQYCEFFKNWRKLGDEPLYLQDYYKRVELMEEGRNSRMKARDVEAMQKIKKQRPPIITDMRYVVMRRTINFEKARYQKALQNNLESDQFFLNNNLDLITSHLAEYDVSLVFLKSLQKVQICSECYLIYYFVEQELLEKAEQNKQIFMYKQSQKKPPKPRNRQDIIIETNSPILKPIKIKKLQIKSPSRYFRLRTESLDTTVNDDIDSSLLHVKSRNNRLPKFITQNDTLLTLSVGNSQDFKRQITINQSSFSKNSNISLSKSRFSRNSTQEKLNTLPELTQKEIEKKFGHKFFKPRHSLIPNRGSSMNQTIDINDELFSDSAKDYLKQEVQDIIEKIKKRKFKIKKKKKKSWKYLNVKEAFETYNVEFNKQSDKL
eukprot:403374468